MQQDSSSENLVEDNAPVKTPASKVFDKFEKDEFAYLKNTGFSSEIFKIEIKNLPKYYGFGEIKKLINTTLGLESNKIKVPKKNSPYGFICFKNDDDRLKALTALNGYNWKGNILKASFANPAHDPLIKKRKQEDSNNGSDSKKPRTVAEGSEPLGHLEYPEQLSIKQKKIEDNLKQFKIDLRRANSIQRKMPHDQNNDLICELRDIVQSPLTEAYRNKCEFSIGKTVDGDIEVGNRLSSYASGCTSVANVAELKLPTPRMKLAAQLVKQFVLESGLEPFNAENYTGIFRNLTIRESRQNGFMMIIGIHPQQMTDEEKDKFQKDFVSFFEVGNGKDLNVTSLYYEEIQKRQSGQVGNFIKHIFGDTHIYEYIHGLKFRISPCSFFQANTAAAENLYQLAIDLSQSKKDSTVLDICCGTGTIGLCFAKHCKWVYGMEIIPQAIEDAKANARENGITNATFTAGNADDLIFSMVREANVGADEDIIAIVDPPRAGLQTKSIQQLRNSEKIKRLVYISCSPSQALKNFVDLCKNCSKTMKGNPFVPKVAVPVDLFPNTPHCELVVLFER
ncbi:CLUMA_CG013565, isoform A [Clunio marinus]|uniref:tRNA (uracil(54)-C(5))-methyltransferase n=1 Tax=Clunio marinus TaxID=568069 RepID=A0A1J1IL58_9DIPT|nr:CLUMA_CG013565, isoform A [Clunio marinus]